MGFLSDFGKDIALQLTGGVVNSIGSKLGMIDQSKQSKDLMDYQWDNYQSPKAQVRNLTAAGINPAAAFMQNAPVLNAAPSAPSVGMPNYGIGTTSLSDMANYIKSLADAKKAGADTKVAERDAKIKEIQSERDEFELELRKLFGVKKEWTSLATSAANYRLAVLSGDKAEIEKAIGEYTKAKESALATTAEHQRDIVKKQLDNMDNRLQLENDVIRETAKTEKSKQSANYASAEQSKSQAAVNRQIERIQHVFADVEESGKTEKIATLLNHYKTAKMIDDKDYQEAHRMYERLKTINKSNDSSTWNKYADAIMFYLEEHIHGLSPFTGLVK